jgi:hypothetical protein
MILESKNIEFVISKKQNGLLCARKDLFQISVFFSFRRRISDAGTEFGLLLLKSSDILEQSIPS